MLLSQTQTFISEQYGGGTNNHPDYANYKKEIASIIQHSYLISLGVGLVAFTFLQLSKVIYGQILSYPEHITHNVAAVCVPLAWGAPFQLMVLVDQALVIATKRASILFPIAIFDTLFACIANYLLIFGHAGFPKLGIASLGYVGMARMIITWLIYKLYFAFSKYYREFNLFKPNLNFSQNYTFSIFKESLPIFGIQAFLAGARIAMARIITAIGDDRNELMQVNVTSTTLLNIIPLSTIIATGTLVSRSISNNDNNESLKSYASAGMKFATIFTSIASLLLIVFPIQISNILTDISKLSPYLRDNLRIIFIGYAINNIFTVIQNGLITNLKNIHKTYFAGIVNMLTISMVLPFTYLVGKVLELDLIGVNLVDFLGLMLSSLLMYRKWFVETNDHVSNFFPNNWSCSNLFKSIHSCFGSNSNEDNDLLVNQTEGQTLLAT